MCSEKLFNICTVINNVKRPLNQSFCYKHAMGWSWVGEVGTTVNPENTISKNHEITVWTHHLETWTDKKVEGCCLWKVGLGMK